MKPVIILSVEEAQKISNYLKNAKDINLEENQNLYLLSEELRKRIKLAEG